MTIDGAENESIFSPERRALSLAILSTIAIIAYNNLAISAALPEVGNDLGDVALLPWTISVELLTSGVAILAAGPLIDSLGVRRLFRVSVIGFIMTSSLCATAPSMAWLIAGRAAQGVTAGVLLTCGMSAVGISYERSVRTRVFAANSTVWGLTSVAGPSIAAVMVSVASWRGVFVFNIPVAAVAAVLAWRVMPDRPVGAVGSRVDWRGLILVAAISGAGLIVVRGTPQAVGFGIVVTSLGAVLYRYHAARHPTPVVRPRHLVEGRYRTVHATSFLALTAGLGAHTFLPVYLTGGRGVGSTAAAFSIVYLSVGWSVGAFTASRLQRHFAPESIILGGVSWMVPMFAVCTAAIIWETPLSTLYAALLGTGLGIGTVSTTGNNLLQHRAPLAEMGRLNAAHQFTRIMGITYGVGVAGAIILTTVDRRTGNVEAVRELLGGDSDIVNEEVAKALTEGYSLAFFAATIVAALAIPAALHLVRTAQEQVVSGP